MRYHYQNILFQFSIVDSDGYLMIRNNERFHSETRFFKDSKEDVRFQALFAAALRFVLYRILLFRLIVGEIERSGGAVAQQAAKIWRSTHFERNFRTTVSINDSPILFLLLFFAFYPFCSTC